MVLERWAPPERGFNEHDVEAPPGGGWCGTPECGEMGDGDGEEAGREVGAADGEGEIKGEGRECPP